MSKRNKNKQNLTLNTPTNSDVFSESVPEPIAETIEKMPIEDNNEETKQEVNEYSIYDYLTKNTSVLFTVIAGFVAVMTFLIKFISHLKITYTLKYWCVDPNLISGDNSNLLYSICAVIFAISAFIISSLFSSDVKSHIKLSLQLSIVKKTNISLEKKKIKKCKKEIAKQKKSKNGSKENEEISREIIEHKNKIEQIKTKYQDMSNSKSQKNSQNIWTSFAISFFLLFIMFFIIFTLFSENYKLGLLMTSLISTVFIYLTLFMDIVSIMDLLSKTKYNIKYESNVNLLNAKEPLLAKIKSNGIRSIFSNKMIKKSFRCFVLIYFIMFLTIFSMSESSMKDKKQFKMFNIENISYVSVYSDSKRMILEEVTVDNGTATIDTSKQKVIYVENHDFEVVTFDEVIRLNTP